LSRIEPAVLLDESWLNTDIGDEQTDYREDPTNPAVLLFTSGTSAAPKAAVLHHASLMAYVLNTLDFASAEESEAVLLAVPPFHIAGVAAVLSSTFVGRRIVPMAQFQASQWLSLAQAEGVTHAMVVPTMLARIVSILESDPSLRPRTLRSIAYGGSRMPTPVLERALQLLPDVDFVNAYGLTETSSTVAVLGPEDHRLAMTSDDPNIRRRLDSVGRPVPGIEFMISDGEVCIRGEQVGGGYVDTASPIDKEGWLHTGDRGFIDDEGYVYIIDRADDMIIRGGENISPKEVEDALQRHPNVTGAAVVGLPDIEWGEKIAAMIVVKPESEIDIEEIRRHVQKQLGSLKTPEMIVVIDELPTNPTGKVMRRSVREILAP